MASYTRGVSSNRFQSVIKPSRRDDCTDDVPVWIEINLPATAFPNHVGPAARFAANVKTVTPLAISNNRYIRSAFRSPNMLRGLRIIKQDSLAIRASVTSVSSRA